ncbi:MAG TPA: hypothetical protein VN734_17390 [Acidobacteriaceae bacterium]|nr:hypothetical protein [Acidobacteriaceae bacterium]
MATMDQVVAAYLQLRQQRDELKKKQAEEMAPINDKLLKLQSWCQQQLQSQGQKNARVDSGTCFLQTDTSVTVSDWDEFQGFVKENDMFAMLEKRASKGVVQEYIEATGEIPPGLKVTSEITCHIRKS